jgi:TolA-binding protein
MAVNAYQCLSHESRLETVETRVTELNEGVQELKTDLVKFAASSEKNFAVLDVKLDTLINAIEKVNKQTEKQEELEVKKEEAAIESKKEWSSWVRNLLWALSVGGTGLATWLFQHYGGK